MDLTGVWVSIGTTMFYIMDKYAKELPMTLREKVAQAVVELEPRLEDLVEGHVELMEVDEEKRIVTLKWIGGRLH